MEQFNPPKYTTTLSPGQIVDQQWEAEMKAIFADLLGLDQDQEMVDTPDDKVDLAECDTNGDDRATNTNDDEDVLMSDTQSIAQSEQEPWASLTEPDYIPFDDDEDDDEYEAVPVSEPQDPAPNLSELVWPYEFAYLTDTILIPPSAYQRRPRSERRVVRRWLFDNYLMEYLDAIVYPIRSMTQVSCPFRTHPAFPATRMQFYLLTSDQMEDMMAFYGQIQRGRDWMRYPCPVMWDSHAHIVTKRWRLGQFIGIIRPQSAKLPEEVKGWLNAIEDELLRRMRETSQYDGKERFYC